MISPTRNQHKLAAVCRATASYLRDREPWQSAVTQLHDTPPVPCSSLVVAPVGWRDVLSELVGVDLARSLADAADALCWRQNPGYVDPHFLARYRYCELIGPKGHAYSAEYAVGFLYLAAHTVYPMHHHPAQECYHVLTSGSRWRAGTGDWQQRAPGERILHDSGVAHAMCTDDAAMLAIYLWRGDIGAPARLASHT